LTACYQEEPVGVPLVDISDCAERLGTTVRHVRRLVSGRDIEYVKVGGLVKFHPATIERYIADHTVPVVKKPARAS
jgi:excisionase family DNA binding protein